MSTWHGGQHKRKLTGGRKCVNRERRRFESGSFPTETAVGAHSAKTDRRRGGNFKTRLVRTNEVNVSDPSKGETKRVKILRVLQNPANVDYDRRGVVTKGTLLETPLGTVKVTSKPGQSGVLNAVLTPESTK